MYAVLGIEVMPASFNLNYRMYLSHPHTGACLSPAGEYNMRLGVLKELKPKMVATFSDKAGAHEGHPFLVEAAISLGGSQVREGINVYRFANRIPLLFEAGADVVTQVSMLFCWVLTCHFEML